MDRNKNKLEDFFRSSLENQDNQPAPNGWDSPPDDVWENIADTLHPPKKDRNLIYWKWGLGLVAALLLVLIFKMHQQNVHLSDLDKTITEQSTQIQNLKDQIDNNTTDEKNDLSHNDIENKRLESNSENQGTPKEAMASAHELQNKSNPVTISSPNQNSSSKTSTSSIKQKDSETGQTHNPLPILSNDTPVVKTEKTNNVVLPTPEIKGLPTEKQKVLSVSNHSEQKIETTLLKLNSMALNPFGFHENFELPASMKVINDPQLPTSVKPHEERFSGFYYGLHYSPTFRSRSLDIPNNRILERLLNRQEDSGYSNGFGARIGYKITPNWSIESGISTSAMTIANRHQITKVYQRDEWMTSTNGELENQENITLPTSMGDVAATVRLSHDASANIEEGRLIHIDILAENQFRFVSVPLLVKYNLGSRQFRFSLHGGLQFDFMTRTDFTISGVNPRSGELISRTPSNRTKLNDVNTLSAAYTFGVGLHYNFTKNLSLAIEPSYSGSIQPVYEKGPLKTYLTAMNVNVGIQYGF